MDQSDDEVAQQQQGDCARDDSHAVFQLSCDEASANPTAGGRMRPTSAR
jgi:hypothetical protein